MASRQTLAARGYRHRLKREGDRLVIELLRNGRLLDLLARLQPLQETFPDVDDALAPLDEVDV